MKRLTFALGMLALIALSSCNRPSASPETTLDLFVLNEDDRKLAAELDLDTTVIAAIRSTNLTTLSPFPATPGEEFGYEREDSHFVPLKGFMFKEGNGKSYDMVLKHKDQFLQKGYVIFLYQNNFGIGNQLDEIGVLKTTDQWAVLKHVQTNGANYGIDTDSLVTKIKEFHAQYDLQLIGASFDWCEFEIHGKVADWEKFAEDVYAFCPDVVDQGTESVEELALEMERSRRLYFWWD